MKKVVFQPFLKMYIAAIISTIRACMLGIKELKYSPSLVCFWLAQLPFYMKILNPFVHDFERETWGGGRRICSMENIFQKHSKVLKALVNPFISLTHNIVIFQGNLSNSDVCCE